MGIQSEENWKWNAWKEAFSEKQIYTNTKILKVEQTYVLVTFRSKVRMFTFISIEEK